MLICLLPMMPLCLIFSLLRDAAIVCSRAIIFMRLMPYMRLRVVCLFSRCRERDDVVER